VTIEDQIAALHEEVRALRADVAALRPARVEPTPIYLATARYAARLGVSRWTVARLVRDGLPTVGRGRLRRVDVAAADAWLKRRDTSGETAIGGIEQRARRAARGAR
jgi:excisionase family DNA binding protein